MAAPLAKFIKEEQRPVIRFLSSEGVKPIEIHRQMKVWYGDACLSLQQVYKWTRKFVPPHQNRKIPHKTICGRGYADSVLG
jgi:hypothetical protein